MSVSTSILKAGVLRSLGYQIAQYRGAHASVRARNEYNVVVVGGGAGGCSVAARLCRQSGGKADIAVIEPAEVHYNKPLFTFVGGGVKSLEDSARPMGEVLPSRCHWVKDRVTNFDPDNNCLTTQQGDKINYNYLIVSVGLHSDFNQIKGLTEALESDPMVVSNFSSAYVDKTFKAMQSFKEGNAIFTFPNTPVNCAGAPQKIMYLTEEYLRTSGKRDKANVMYNSSLGVLFGIKKYADSLWKIVEERGLQINLRHNLIEVRPDKKEAVFEKMDADPKETVTFPYEMLHATPPMTTPEVLRRSPLAGDKGYMSVNKCTMQHTKYPNVFGLGDCTDIPTSKTAAAIAAQNAILVNSLEEVLSGKEPSGQYDGYSSCPLVTSRSTCILAEFDFDGKPLETFPVDQSIERRSMYHLKRDIMPQIYWAMLLKGRWSGPELARRALHLGLKK